jgi:hypothetical protein
MGCHPLRGFITNSVVAIVGKAGPENCIRWSKRGCKQMGGTLYCNIVSYVESSKGMANQLLRRVSAWKIVRWTDFSTNDNLRFTGGVVRNG